MKRTVVCFILVAAFMGCASPKKAQEAPQESTFITYDTIPIPSESVTQPEVSTENEARIHIVKKGESLSVIAKQYGVTVKALAEANKITNTNLIKINQELVIPELRGK